MIGDHPLSDHPLTNPNVLDVALKPLLARWEAICHSPHIHYAKLIPPCYAATLRGKSISQKLGLRYERKVFAALARGDFTQNLCDSFATNSYSHSKVNPQVINSEKQVKQNQIKNQFLFLHNPNFNYFETKNKTKQKLCIPDILIFCPKLPSQFYFPLSSISLSKQTPNPLDSISLPNPLSSISQPKDLVSIDINNFSFIICCEVKYTYVESALHKLKTLYLPVIHKSFNLPVIPLIIVKNLTPFSPPSTPNLSSALHNKIPLLIFSGAGGIY